MRNRKYLIFFHTCLVGCGKLMKNYFIWLRRKVIQYKKKNSLYKFILMPFYINSFLIIYNGENKIKVEVQNLK